MDEPNPPIDPTGPGRPDHTPRTAATTLRWGPDRRLTAAVGVAAVILALGAVVTDDAGGRLLFVVAALVLAAYVVTDLIFNPRLTATRAGLVLNAPFARAHLSWDDVEFYGADSRSRYGVRSTTLEVDAGAVLAVFSRRGLGQDPAEVADLLSALDPRPPALRRRSERRRGQPGHGHHQDQDPGQTG